MKKVLALVIAVMLLVAMTPIALAADTTVNVSVSVDGKLVVAAQPVATSDATIQGAIIAAHKAYCSAGVDGYAAGIDPTYNMFLINTCWDVTATPYVIQNGAPLQVTADTAPIAAGDNIIICTSSDQTKPATPVSLTATVADGKATVTALNWALDFTTFTYKSSPAANSKVIDPATGTSLGTTDANGVIVVPAVGSVAIPGLAAIVVGPAAAATTTAAPGTALPKTDGVSTSTIIGFVGLGLIVLSAAMFVLKKKNADQAN